MRKWFSLKPPTNQLDGLTGTILGKSVVSVEDHYIVLLDKPMLDRKALCITEHCLELVK